VKEVVGQAYLGKRGQGAAPLLPEQDYRRSVALRIKDLVGAWK
jgi:hypothetical protein